MSGTAFLTGGTGFVGANLARELVARGWNVRALARKGSDRRNLDGLALEIVDGALDEPRLAEAMRGCDVLFHVAAHYSLFRADRDAVIAANVDGTRSVLAAAREAGVAKTVYTSSVAAIGVKSGSVADETYQSAPQRLIGAYKLSKYLAEREAVAAAENGQFVTIVNPTTPIGPWDRKPTPTGEILVRLLTGNMPAVVDTGLNFVDVDDVVRGQLLAYERGRSGERYILGGENRSLRTFLATAADIAGVRAPRIAIPHWIPLGVAWLDETVLPRFGLTPTIPIDGVKMSRESMYYKSDKAARELGYTSTPIATAIASAISWFKENGYAAVGRLR